MKNQIQRILKLNHFFKVQSTNDVYAQYKLEEPSKILMQNIYSNWLKSIYTKTEKHFLVFINKPSLSKSTKLPYGYVSNFTTQADQVFHHEFNNLAPSQPTQLQCNFIVEMKDIMPYFFQWQRYRKYWWSSITTTPSLFGIDDTKENEGTTSVNIIAKFPWGTEIVENLYVKNQYENERNVSLLNCNTTIEGAFFTLLLDGSINSTKEYSKLHRKVAPYKISFALNNKDDSKKNNLKELAIILHHNLKKRNISSLLPEFTIPMAEQLKENLKFGIIYTAILSDSTLSDGIIHLLNSSTTLKEQVHVADFQSYGTLIFQK